ncbi:hypothetical protein BJX64DRAFT_291366 [Aspergillus heterothallicus]
MTRGNQRDRDREKQRKKAASEKSANNLSGTAFQRKKEDDAAKMREKQAKGGLDSQLASLWWRGVSFNSIHSLFGNTHILATL